MITPNLIVPLCDQLTFAPCLACGHSWQEHGSCEWGMCQVAGCPCWFYLM